METLEILRPSLRFEELTTNYGKLHIEPLDRGYGMTLGNAIRRVLLSSIRGAAITSVRIEGVLHEFSTVPGVREDVIEIMMNLKKIPVLCHAKDPRYLTVDVAREGVVTAADISTDSQVEFTELDAPICHLEEGAHIMMELCVEQGTGYLSSERPRPANIPVDALLTDAVFSPVLRVNYRVEAARVGQRTDYERLALELWTNGVVPPDLAVGEAAQIAQTYFGHIVASIEQVDGAEPEDEEVYSYEAPNTDDEILARPVRDLELSIRSENCLLRGGILTIGDLLQQTREDLLKIRNLGKISLTEIEEKVRESGLTLRSSGRRRARVEQPAPLLDPVEAVMAAQASGAIEPGSVAEAMTAAASAANSTAQDEATSEAKSEAQAESASEAASEAQAESEVNAEVKAESAEPAPEGAKAKPKKKPSKAKKPKAEAGETEETPEGAGDPEGQAGE